MAGEHTSKTVGKAQMKSQSIIQSYWKKDYHCNAIILEEELPTVLPSYWQLDSLLHCNYTGSIIAYCIANLLTVGLSALLKSYWQ